MSNVEQTGRATIWLGAITFALVATGGLLYVKWVPYYNRAFAAAANHSIGLSILMGANPSAPSPSWAAAVGYALAYGKAVWQAMVFGLLLGSAIQALLPVEWVARLLGKAGFSSVAKGGLLAVPGMMCTCCAAPVVVGLRERLASPGAAISFWLGNSVLNPATLIFMGFVLGWTWTGLRFVLGILMVFGLGYLINRIMTPAEMAAVDKRLGELAVNQQKFSIFKRWIFILWQMAIRLIPEYILLVLLLGAARAWLFPHAGPEIGNSIAWIIAFAVAGTLFVIPTAGEVPIVQAMLALGVGHGPAGALLMTLPPISVPSLAIVSRSFKPRVLVIVTLVVVAFGIIGGLLAALLKF
ncbi:permease [Bradyrhizobium sp. USDA 10063]